ncbi:glycosyltransferase [Marinomonas pollencensis]|uniref:Glycosyl transferase family 2 n=1 Tax=Marinomonas pollencensis TaxID=491954 RepID=A0A3E0D6W8_9GAMM|nr:glycosyltransferase [Marinomonas pollencensis]REG78450.1 glycosyl transferase family 2 [Marinomonas pollencensis]
MSVYVSLTAINQRLSVLRYTLMSLLEQSYKPDYIVLNLSKDAYLLDEGVHQLPDWLTAMESNGVSINWVENTGSYRKLLPVFRSITPEDILVTCDDDVIYGEDWLKHLLQAAEQHPDDIVCGRARKPVNSPLGGYQSYLNWPLAEAGTHKLHLIPIGIAGIVYRKKLLKDSIIASQAFLTEAPKQDDLWYRHASLALGTKVFVAPGVNAQVYPINTPEELSRTNTVTAVIRTWDNFMFALFSKFKTRLKAYLGIKVCDNDHVIKRLELFKTH